MSEEMKELSSRQVIVDAEDGTSKVRNNRRHFKDKTPVAWILINAIIVIVLIVYGFKLCVFNDDTHVPFDVCLTDACNESAAVLLSQINESVNPCENFYDFVCGKASYLSKLLSTLVKSLHSLHNLIKDRISDESPEYLKKLKRMYKSCDCDSKKNTTQNELKRVFDKMGGWPILKNNTKQNETESDWIEMVLKCRREGLHFEHFLELNVILDSKNYSRKVIHLSHPKLGLKRHVLETDFGEFVTSYKRTMMNVAKQMGADDSGDSLRDEIADAFAFQMDLLEISVSEDDDLLNSTRTTIGDLEAKYPNIRWLDLLDGILSIRSTTKLDSSEVVYIPNSHFIDKFYHLMTKRKPSNRVVTNFVYWRLLVYVINHDPCSEFDDSIKDNNLFYSQRRTPDDCKTEMVSIMNIASDALLARNVYDAKDAAIVKVMSENIRRTFTWIIEKIDWLAKETKDNILNRISGLNNIIGYPEEIFNDTKLNDFYEDLDVPEKGNYWLYSMNYHKFIWNRINRNFKKPSGNYDWTMGQVGNMPAYLRTNEIKIPAMMLDPLFFSKNFPNYLNYGMIGSIIGHEMLHSLAKFGEETDDYGKKQDIWWDDKSLEMYSNKTKCLIEKYSNYSSAEFRLNGERTLHENIADIDGLRISYYAYLNSTKSELDDLVLPGFENFTPNQLFWIAAGSNWCEESQKNMTTIASSSQNRDEVHSPERFRVLGPMSTLEEFAVDFNCKPTDAMNPPDKCPVW